MKERPILFSGAMVRALLDGRKTQTRRVIKSAGVADAQSLGAKAACCPYAEGQKLWVRETFAYVGPGSGSELPDHVEERSRPENHLPANCWYRATREDEPIRWTPAIHMPRWASRITLEVTGVRIERLHAITEADAIDEGSLTLDNDWLREQFPAYFTELDAVPYGGKPQLGPSPRTRFTALGTASTLRAAMGGTSVRGCGSSSLGE
jgi:hypothetical protein